MTTLGVISRIGRPLRDGIVELVERVRRWALVVAGFVLVQLVIQALGALTGLVLVRAMTKADYAVYTVAGTILPAAYLLANSGVTFAASAIGGRVWQDRLRLGQVVVTAFSASRLMAGIVTMPILLFLTLLLHRVGASAGEISVIVVLVFAAAAVQFATGILIVVPRLLGEFRFLQGVELSAGILRCAAVLVAAMIFIDPEIALTIAVAAFLVQGLLVWFRVKDRVDLSVPVDPAMRVEMRQVTARQWLNELYYVSQGQISVFLLSVFGTSASVADFGALGRIAIVFSATSAAMQAVILPRYARCQEPSRLRSLYVQIFAINGIVAVLPVLVAFFFSRQLLWLLGPKYFGLSHELLLVTLNAGAASLAGIAGHLNAVRAWIVPGWILVPAALAAQFLLMLFVGVSTLPRVLWVSIGSNVLMMALFSVGAIYFGRRFARAQAMGGGT